MTLRPRQVIYRKAAPGIEPVPVQWKPVQNFRYPVDNSHTFERWYLDTYLSGDNRDRIYLPVQWTAIYCNNKFGQDKQVIAKLQVYLDKLDTTKRYYTIVQFDDGILNKIDHLDLKIFSMGGGRVDYPIPLLCMPHRPQKGIKQDLIANFVGRETHPVRKRMTELKDNMSEYTWYMARSKFTLAPRGYGPTSFRLCEAIHAGSVPVYISDKHVLPYNLPFDYGIRLGPDDDIVKAIELADFHWHLQRMREVRELFTYVGCKNMILKELLNEA
jgi:hypothetical protein